jgi:hypothetical protein
MTSAVDRALCGGACSGPCQRVCRTQTPALAYAQVSGAPQTPWPQTTHAQRHHVGGLWPWPDRWA